MAERCGFVHDNAKTPTEYVDWLCKEVKPGADKILANPVGWRATAFGPPPPPEEGASSRNHPHT
jgi:hypothetical protein